MDEAVLQTVAARLEFRATDPGYVALATGYFERLPLAPPCPVLALGCGPASSPVPGRRVAPELPVARGSTTGALIERHRQETAGERVSRTSSTSPGTHTPCPTPAAASTW